jgi:hypothetical protein
VLPRLLGQCVRCICKNSCEMLTVCLVTFVKLLGKQKLKSRLAIKIILNLKTSTMYYSTLLRYDLYRTLLREIYITFSCVAFRLNLSAGRNSNY